MPTVIAGRLTRPPADPLVTRAPAPATVSLAALRERRHGGRVVWHVRCVCHRRALVARVPSCRSGSQEPPCHTTATDERRTVSKDGVRWKHMGATMRVMAVCVARARLVPCACLVLFAPSRARGAMSVPHAYPVRDVR
jgi:hypothetical protein